MQICLQWRLFDPPFQRKVVQVQRYDGGRDRNERKHPRNRMLRWFLQSQGVRIFPIAFVSGDSCSLLERVHAVLREKGGAYQNTYHSKESLFLSAVITQVCWVCFCRLFSAYTVTSNLKSLCFCFVFRTPRKSSTRGRTDSLTQLTQLVHHGERQGLFSDKIPARVERVIKSENLRFMQNRDVYNEEYFSFVKQLTMSTSVSCFSSAYSAYFYVIHSFHIHINNS